MSNQRKVLSKNLKDLIDAKGIDQRILADFLGISEMSVSNWVNGVKYPRMGNIQKMADYFGVMKSDLIEDKKNGVQLTSTKYNYYPTEISAGIPFVADTIEEYHAEQLTIPDYLMGKYAGHNDIYITRVNGESMNKIIPDQSLIAVKPIELSYLKDGDIVVYNYDNEYAVKKYYKHGDKIVFRPDSDNMAFTDQVINLDSEIDLKIKGKVVLYIVEMD